MPAVLITGGHSGIGLACCNQLASVYGLDLILAGRDLSRMEPVAQALRSTYGIEVVTIKLDTSSMASVRSAAAQCRDLLKSGRIDSLQAVACNAGARLLAYAYGADGYEKTFAANYLGHFLLVELLCDLLPDDGRIVFTVSGTHDPDTIDGKLVGAAAPADAVILANLGKDGKKPLSTGQLYSTSKLCMMLHAYELDRRLRSAGSSIGAIAFDPGSTSNTGFLKELPKPIQWVSNKGLLNPLLRRIGVTMGDVEFSGASLARLIADDDFKNASGKYYQSNDGRLAERRSSKASYDDGTALRLWNDSKALVGLEASEESRLIR